MRDITNILIIFFTITSTSICNGQNSEYIQDFSDKINVSASLDSNEYTYKVSNLTDNSFYELKTNQLVRLAASVRYCFLGFTVGFSPDGFNNSEDDVLKGETKIRLIKLRLFIKKFIQEFEYNKVSGFYVENTDDFIENWVKGKDSYLLLDDLNSKVYSGKTTYVWNENFSFKALVVKNQKQLKSAGSFIPSLSYTYSELNNPSKQVVTVDQQNFDLNLNLGYIRNFVFGKNNNFIASLGLSPGLGLKFAKTFQEDSDGIVQGTSDTFPNLSLEGRLNLGYNSDKIFTGLQFNTFGVTYNKNPETKVENSNLYFQLYFGYRFGAPKSIANFFNKINL